MKHPYIWNSKEINRKNKIENISQETAGVFNSLCWTIRSSYILQTYKYIVCGISHQKPLKKNQLIFLLVWKFKKRQLLIVLYMKQHQACQYKRVKIILGTCVRQCACLIDLWLLQQQEVLVKQHHLASVKNEEAVCLNGSQPQFYQSVFFCHLRLCCDHHHHSERRL